MTKPRVYGAVLTLILCLPASVAGAAGAADGNGAAELASAPQADTPQADTPQTGIPQTNSPQTSPSRSDPSQVYGLWLEKDWKVAVRLYACDGGGLCGDLARIPDDMPRRDVNNPDPALRDRPLIGLQVLSDFRPAGHGVWQGGGQHGKVPGRIYLPNKGDMLGDDANSYVLRLDGPDTLSVGLQDCVFSCFLTSTWHRMTADALLPHPGTRVATSGGETWRTHEGL